MTDTYDRKRRNLCFVAKRTNLRRIYITDGLDGPLNLSVRTRGRIGYILYQSQRNVDNVNVITTKLNGNQEFIDSY